MSITYQLGRLDVKEIDVKSLAITVTIFVNQLCDGIHDPLIQ
jgi:hypothetical protein